MEFTKQEIATIRKDYLDKHGIYSGITNRTRRFVNTKVLSTYWTTCPFREDPARQTKYVVESETPTFIKFVGIGHRFRKETIRKDGIGNLNIAYRDTALNKQRFHHNGDNSITNLPSWAEVKHFTDVMVRWDDTDHTIDEDYDEVWFLPNKVLYIGVEATLNFDERYSFTISTSSKIVCSPVKTERTPTAVPFVIQKTWKDNRDRNFRRDNYDGIPFTEDNSIITDQYNAVPRVLLLDGQEISVRHIYPYEDTYAPQMEVVRRFTDQCESAYLPFVAKTTYSYQPRRNTSSVSYDSALRSRGVHRFVDMKHSAREKVYGDDKMEALRKKKEAFAQELVETCLHPDRMERLYGDKFMEIADTL